ncbi:PREDICTED: aspartate and serine-rich protein-like [Ipomoea nil]|uniref:aspartate and serine-rich protein-like n=1 Tax=Ipomoea nil TaxID=35883 RepID=UPI0009018559|nr:PREDICTED: aspartate and serine-rich protein-like [Ipomoea nil]
MKDEEEFALEWLETKDLNEALRLEKIRRVFSYKITNRTLGKDKALICIELNKPPLDPAFEEEMKEVRYALLISKVKTILEKEHQNDPNCSVSGLKDDQGQEIDTTEDEEDEDRDDDVEDVDDENGDNDDDNNDDDNNDDDNDSNNGANLMYDSPSPLLVGPAYDTVPERSPAQKSPSESDGTREASHQDEDVSTTQPEDLSRALVPHVRPMNETPIKREEAVVHEDKLEASPILLSSSSGGKKDAPLQGDKLKPHKQILKKTPLLYLHE